MPSLDSLRAAWNSIPAPLRTVINVAVAASLAVIAGAVVTAHGVTGVDWSATFKSALDALGLGFATAILRAINPLDTAYGIGASRW